MIHESAAAIIAEGSDVKVHLSVILEDGTCALSTRGEEPLALLIGDGTLPPTIERVLQGMRQGEKKCLDLDPEYAWGVPDPSNIHTLPRTDFPADLDPKPGQIIAFDLPNGEDLAGTVLSAQDDRVEMDFNHPMAGHRITLEVEILEVLQLQPAVSNEFLPQ
jgi:FKBP-type peptidyl-prolyl cis-trans isomerase SlpA